MTPRRPRHPTTEPNQLALHVKAWRMRLKPDEIPGLSAAYPQTRRRRFASKELVALLTGCSLGWYSTLERGEPQNYSDDFLTRVAHTLRLNAAEKNMLFFLATGHEPAIEQHSRMQHTPTIQRLLDAQPWPAYIADESWDLIAFNKHMSEWFPWVEGNESNVMRWVFTFPEAQIQLHNWRTDWAPQTFAQLQYAQARQPDNKRLTAIIDEILELSPDARRFKEQPTICTHPDGDRRALHLPCHSKIQLIEIVASEPLRAPGSRCVSLIPVEPED